MSPTSHTSFERRRGVNAVRLRHGLGHIQVTGLPRATLMNARIVALESLERAGVGIDFLKLTSDGFTFVLADSECEKALHALRKDGYAGTSTTGRASISVHCVNIRDEAGIVAKIAETATASGARIEQVGDSHDCILLVVEASAAEKAAAALRETFALDDDDAN